MRADRIIGLPSDVVIERSNGAPPRIQTQGGAQHGRFYAAVTFENRAINSGEIP